MARSKKPANTKSRRPATAKRRKTTALVKRPPKSGGEPATPSATHDIDSHHVKLSRFNLVNEARKVLSRSSWSKDQEDKLSRKCKTLVARLKKTCPHLRVESPLKPGEVFGDVTLGVKSFHSLVSMAAGAKESPQVVWSDGTNELLVDIAGIATRTADGLVAVKIPVTCEELGKTTVLVTFATGSPENPAGLVFATDTVPEGPPEIVECWGESLVALAWTSILRALSTLADVAGKDEDGSGLIPVGLAAQRSGVQLLVMARHEIDRVRR